MAVKRIRVLVVDDSLFMREFISSKLSEDEGIEVVGKAASAFEARDRIVELMPDVMTLDIQMPGMDGIEFLRRLMPQYPLPVVVVSAVNGRVFDALSAGAVDFITKSEMKDDYERKHFVSELIVKLKIASIAKVGQHKHSAVRDLAANRAAGRAGGNGIIAIGASTGGTEATYTILKGSGQRSARYRYRTAYAARVHQAVFGAAQQLVCDGGKGSGGRRRNKTGMRVLIAPGGLHMTVMRRGSGLYVDCREGEKVSGHCPSVDQLFLFDFPA